MVEGITTETCIESRIWLYNNNGTNVRALVVFTPQTIRSYLRVIASSNLYPSLLCFGICWYPNVCCHLKLHLVCSLVETNCHTTLSVKRASSAALVPNRTNQETDEVGIALLTGRTTFWPQRFHAIGRCTLQSESYAKNVQHQLTDCIVCVKLW